MRGGRLREVVAKGGWTVFTKWLLMRSGHYERVDCI